MKECKLVIEHAGGENNAGSIKDMLESGWVITCMSVVGTKVYYAVEREKPC